jgi:hypothetical protein
MPVGLGGAIVEGLGGDLNQQIANKLAGPSPNPNPGAPGGGGAAPPPGANLPPAQAYAPDPVNASTMALLLKVHQQDALGADLNQRIAGISASFGTAQQQHDKMAQLQALGGIPDDRLKAIQESQGIMQEQQKQTEHSQFLAGADLMGQQLLGLKPGQGAWLAKDPDTWHEMVDAHMRSIAPTDQQKLVNDLAARLKANGASDAEVNSTVISLLGGAIGGQTPGEKDMRQDIMRWKQANPGKSDADMLQEHPEFGSVTAYVANKEAQAKTATEAAQTKLDASKSFDAVDSNWKEAQENIEWLQAHKDAVTAAIRRPDLVTSGHGANVLAGVGLENQDVLTAKTKLDWLKNQLFAERFTGTKNVRSNMEAKNLGSAATSLFSTTNDAATVSNELDRLLDRTKAARGNSALAAGRPVDADFAPLIDKALIDPTNPLYNKGSIRNDFSKMTEAQVDAEVAKLQPGEAFVGPDGNIHRKKAQ